MASALLVRGQVEASLTRPLKPGCPPARSCGADPRIESAHNEQPGSGRARRRVPRQARGSWRLRRGGGAVGCCPRQRCGEKPLDRVEWLGALACSAQDQRALESGEEDRGI